MFGIPPLVNSGYNLIISTNGSFNATADSRLGGSGDSVATSTTTFSANSWAHICAVFLGKVNGGHAVYLNGGGKGTAAGMNGDHQVDKTGNAIGVLYTVGSGNFAYQAGLIAEVTLWSAALTDAEILSLAGGIRSYNIRPSSIFGYYPLDGIQSPEPDLSGNANNGTLTGTALAAGSPITMFTPCWPSNIFIPSAAAQIYSLDVVSAHIGRDIEYAVY